MACPGWGNESTEDLDPSVEGVPISSTAFVRSNHMPYLLGLSDPPTVIISV